MNTFEIINGSYDLLDFIEPLWCELNAHHKANSKYFSTRFNNLKFHHRKAKFMDNVTSSINIDLIKDTNLNVYVGYCISTLSRDFIGEIDSIFIKTNYRKFGLGDKLMCRALDWLDFNNCKSKIIGVAEGNDSVIKFYEKYGFYTKTIILQQLKD